MRDPRRIALVAMSAKPFHAGHDGLIRLASAECHSVFLYVSTSDRARKGEAPVLGRDMEHLWREVIARTLPRNVCISYGGSPIGKLWQDLGAMDNDVTRDVFVVYGDPGDLAEAFPENRLQRYCGNLLTQARVILRAVERSSTVNVSGTQMRQWLGEGDKASFIANLPTTIDRERTWDVLRATAADPPKVRTTAKARRGPSVS
jgi:hypothetical protein